MSRLSQIRDRLNKYKTQRYQAEINRLSAKRQEEHIKADIRKQRREIETLKRRHRDDKQGKLARDLWKMANKALTSKPKQRHKRKTKRRRKK